MPTEENKAIIRRRVEEIWNSGNLTTADELIATDYASNGQAIGREGFKQFVASVRTAFPDLHCGSHPTCTFWFAGRTTLLP